MHKKGGRQAGWQTNRKIDRYESRKKTKLQLHTCTLGQKAWAERQMKQNQTNVDTNRCKKKVDKQAGRETNRKN